MNTYASISRLLISFRMRRDFFSDFLSGDSYPVHFRIQIYQIYSVYTFNPIPAGRFLRTFKAQGNAQKVEN